MTVEYALQPAPFLPCIDSKMLCVQLYRLVLLIKHAFCLLVHLLVVKFDPMFVLDQ